ncbi:MAG: hypothetical protein NC213_02110 [Acetobacter sp.]|nr:hypothetical protein [Bacteroides sp.]MCM1340514.1 hypothetical protein [Acetobacter sp.]MCM1433254.1 hypothetical protein [Clostridiales bacterium]
MKKLNSKGKRILSLFLAVLMLTTSLPLAAFNAFALTWHPIASQNFSTVGENAISESSWAYDSANESNCGGWSTTYMVVSKRYHYGWKQADYSYNLNDSSSGMSWKSVIWNNDITYIKQDQMNEVKDSDITEEQRAAGRPSSITKLNSSTIDDKGTYLNNGYMYMTGYGDNTGLPITGKDRFKIDVEFQVTEGSTIPQSAKTNSYNSYTFLTLGKDLYSKVNAKKWDSSAYVFSQCASGKAYVPADSSDSMSIAYGMKTKSNSNDTTDNDYTFAAENRNLNAGTDYHYVLAYSDNMLRGCVTDDDGNIKINLFAYRCSLNTNDIKSIVLGNDTNEFNYIEQIIYKNITFYSGEKDADIEADKNLNHYLFAYFTGNDDERIRFAVSDDGYNFEALNGNNPVMNNKANVTYPSSTTNAGIAASERARDPFIIRKQDNNGFKDGYYIVATDLNINATNYRNSKFLVWDVNDIANAGDVVPWNVETCDWFSGYSALPSDSTGSKDYYAWAPEAIWDREKEQYMLYWSAPMITNNQGYNYLRIYCAYTDNFQTFYNAQGAEIGKNGVEPDLLLNPGARCIDANITFDGNLYYMYYKYEADGQIHYAVSEHANGPYVGNTKFVDTDYSDYKMEGCEVYQLADGSYNFIADCYKDGTNGKNYMYDGYFLVYNSETLDGFENNNQNAITNLNYLTPRHGSIAPISSSEYEALIARYGKITFDTNGIRDNSDVNQYLVARYFATENVNEDATGHGFDLTSANLEMGADGEHDYAQFNANGLKSSAYTQASYASIQTGGMFKSMRGGINAKDGVTFDWYGSIDTDIWSNFFSLTSSSSMGMSTPNGKGVYYNAQNSYGVFDGTDQTTCWGYQKNANYTSTGKWRHYTINLSESYISLFIDGQLLGKQYVDKGANDEANRNGSSSSGSPTFSALTTTSWFDELFNGGTLYMGVSAWEDDLFTGKISDFRIYSKALTPAEIKISELSLEDYLPGTDISSEDENRVFYDPMETTEVNGVQYTEYSDSIADPVTVKVDKTADAADVPVHGTVLETKNNGTTSHYVFEPKTVNSDTDAENAGVTIVFGYNPTDSLSGTIFNIGETGTQETSNRRYFTLLEDGRLYYNWEFNGQPSYCDITNVFGGKLQPDVWQHIVIQIEPTGSYETIYVYIDSELVSKTKTRQYAEHMTASNSVFDFFTAPESSNNGSNHNVYYGTSYGYDGWGNGAGYIDDFSIYNGLYTPDSIYVAQALRQVDTFIPRSLDMFKEKMAQLPEVLKKDNAVYSNIGNAYDMYDKINRYLDSVNFGGVERDDSILARYYVELRTAMNNIENYTSPSTVEGLDKTETFYNNSIDPKFTQNMLTKPIISRGKELDGGTQSEMNLAVYSSAFVWLYDGENTPTAPINGAVYLQQKGVLRQDGNFYNIHIKDNNAESYNDIQFGGLGYGGTDDGYWHMSQRIIKTDADWYYDDYYKPMGYVADQTDVSLAYRDIPENQKWYGGSNYLTYQGSLADDVYQVSFIPEYNAQFYRTWIGGKNSFESKVSSTGRIFVINYVPVKNALLDSDIIDYLSNITQYSPAYANELIDAYDALTGQNYILDDANAAAVNSLATTLEDNVNRLLGLKDKWNTDLAEDKTSYDMADYDELINTADSEHKELEEIKANGLEGKYDENTDYTQTSWNEYVDSVDNVKEHFNSLNPEDKDQPYATNQDVVDGMVDDITESKRKLVVVADYEPVDTAVTDYADDYNNGVGTSYEDQTWTISSYLDFADAYDTAKDVSENGDRVNLPKYNTASPYDSADPSTWTVLSDGQININDTAENTDVKHNDLADVDNELAYESYDKAQSLFAMADKEAYTDQAKQVLAGWGSQSSAQPYDKNLDSVYVEYNGAIYKNTAVGETDEYTRQVLTTINGGDESTTDSTGAKTRTPYEVTFNVYEDGQLVSTDVSTHYYGEIVPLTYSGTGKVVTWSAERKGTDKTFVKNTESTYDVKIQSDSTISVYASIDTDLYEVQVKDYFGRVQVAYVPAGTTATVNGETISFSDGTPAITNQSCNYMTFTGFTVDKEQIESSIVIDKDTIIIATGKKDANTLAYSIEGGTFADGTSQQNYKLDDVITITASIPECKGIAIKTADGWTMLTYGSTYRIYAFPEIKAFGGKVEFKAMSPDDYAALIGSDDIAPQSFGVGTYSNNKLAMYCTMTTGLNAEKVKIIERGVIAATSPENLFKGETGVKTFRSSTDIMNAQYMYTITNGSGKALYARSYVCYELQYDSNTSIPLVAYGDVVASDAC